MLKSTPMSEITPLFTLRSRTAEHLSASALTGRITLLKRKRRQPRRPPPKSLRDSLKLLEKRLEPTSTRQARMSHVPFKDVPSLAIHTDHIIDTSLTGKMPSGETNTPIFSPSNGELTQRTSLYAIVVWERTLSWSLEPPLP